jgi:hypothetical protein
MYLGLDMLCGSVVGTGSLSQSIGPTESGLDHEIT